MFQPRQLGALVYFRSSCLGGDAGACGGSYFLATTACCIPICDSLFVFFTCLMYPIICTPHLKTPRPAEITRSKMSTVKTPHVENADWSVNCMVRLDVCFTLD